MELRLRRLYLNSLLTLNSGETQKHPTGFRASALTQVESLAPRLQPSKGFFEKRDRVRSRLEQVLIQQVPQIPRGSTLRVFGSTSNGFGTDNADLDM